ncbi:MAG TPA: NAD-dependent epimerase/dehydratase family protein [Thermoanaerobaculia bacterium]|nr:NAD-dependent epimerase/dehydratase family protein [Thermoanaerobaculia bacterium]
MKIVLFGATGMIGAGALLECLDDSRVDRVVAVGRRSCGVAHAKLTEVLLEDFFRYDAALPQLSGADACFFCLGVSAAGMSEEEYTRVTHDLTLAAAEALLRAGSRRAFCYVSGAGTDATGRGRTMWARVKGRTESDLRALPFDAAYMLRPGYVQPRRGVRSRTAPYRAFYAVFGVFYPLLSRAFPALVTNTVVVGRALLRLAAEGSPERILETRDINRLGAAA